MKQTLRNTLFRIPYLGRKYRQLLADAETLHRLEPGHYSSPIPSPEDIQREVASTASIRDDSLPGIPLQTDRQLNLLGRLATYLRDSPLERTESDSARYFTDNDWFQRTDGFVLHAMLRELKPKRIVEIGSGFSSAVILDTIDGDPDLRTDATFIEPNPERLLSRLRPEDLDRIRHIRSELQDCDGGLFGELESGDILFVDSSHVSKCGSDVNEVLHEILPRLDPGVVIHFHDIFFPFRYPKRLTDNDHYWNEAYLLRSFLQFNQDFELLLWNDYLRQEHESAFNEVFGVGHTDIAASFWMRRKEAGSRQGLSPA